MNALLKCKVALDITCRLTLSIFYFISHDGFVNSFFPFRSTFGIFNLFLTMNWKVKITEGFEHPNILVRSQRPYPLGYAAWWRLCQFVFIAVSDLGEKWSGTRRLLSSHCVNLFFARNWCLLSSSLVCLVKAGRTDVAGFLFVNHDWDLRPRNCNLRPQRDLNIRSSDSEADTLSVGLWGLFQFCFVTINELTDV